MSKEKKNTGEVAVLDNFKPTKQNIFILFKDGVYNEPNERFEVETRSFLDIKGYSLHGPYLIVQEKDDTQYVYPMEDIKELKLTITKE